MKHISEMHNTLSYLLDWNKARLQGLTGPTGMKRATGATGMKGATGDTGATGATGMN